MAARSDGAGRSDETEGGEARSGDGPLSDGQPFDRWTGDAAEVLARVREIAARFPEVGERLSHGAPTFFIRDKKVLATLYSDHHGDGRLAIWCAAALGVQAELVEQEPGRFFVPPYVGHRGWIGLRLDIDPDWNEVAGVLDDAYRLVAPKTLVKQLDGQP